MVVSVIVLLGLALLYLICTSHCILRYDTIRYDRIQYIYVRSKAEEVVSLICIVLSM